jgi:phage shock protein A
MGRVWNLIKGFFSLFVSKVEQEHPEIVYQNSIDSLTEKAVKLRQAAASIIRRRDEIEERYENKARESKEVEAQLQVAIQNGDEEVGTLLVEKKDVLDVEIAELQRDMEQARADANDIKSALLKIQAERDKLIAEKDRMVGKLASAQARVKIQEQLEGLSLDSDVKALDNVRTHIKNKIAEANLGKELSESSLDARLEKIKSQVGSVQAQTKFQQMRQQHLNAQQQQQGNKSL